MKAAHESMHQSVQRAFATIAVLIALFVTPSNAADDRFSDARFLEGLRARQLFELAEAFCDEQLANSALPLRTRLDLTLELSRTYAEHALHSVGPQRDRNWEQALAAVDPPPPLLQGHPRLVLLGVQAGLVLLAQGELMQQEAETVDEPDRSQRLEAARSPLRKGIQRLRDASAAINDLSRGGGRVSGSKEEPLSEQELRSLAANVRYQLARAHRTLAQTYPPESVDFLNQMQEALELLDPLAKGGDDDPLAWPSRIQVAACHRLLRDNDEALRRLTALARPDTPPEIQIEARAEMIRLAISQKRPEAGVKLYESFRPPKPVPAYEFAGLEAYLAAWQQALYSVKGPALQAKTLEQVKKIEQAFGSYWGRRAELALARYVRSSPGGGGDVGLVVRAAESHYRAKQYEASKKEYDRAAQMAAKAGDEAKAFEYGYLAAAIEHQLASSTATPNSTEPNTPEAAAEKLKHAAEAAARFRTLALGAANLPKAADAHLLAVFNAAQVARSGKSADLDAYRKLLEEHVKKWPNSPTVAQVRFWQGRLATALNQPEVAIEAYTQVPADHPRYGEAVADAAAAYEQLLNALRAANKPSAPVARKAEAYLLAVITGGKNTLPAEWSDLARETALPLARIWVNEGTKEDYSRAEQVLSAALAGKPEPSPTWQAAAEALLVVSRAGLGRDQSATTFANLAQARPADLLDMLDNLSRIATSGTALSRDLAKLRLEAVRLLNERRNQLDEEARRRVDLAEFTALADAGRSIDANKVLDRMLTANKRDGNLLEEAATRLVEANDRASLERALDLWRRLAELSQPATPRWFRARYYQALAHEKLNHKEEAVKVITILQLLHPDLGGPEWKPKFLDLLRRCQK